MKLLLDTHAWLWWVTDDGKLSARARSAIEEAAQVFVSSVSAWEISTRQRLGGSPDATGYVASLEQAVKRAGMELMPLSFVHGLRAGGYACAHRDPFDRLLAAQAETEGLTLVTRDSLFAQFPIQTLW